MDRKSLTIVAEKALHRLGLDRAVSYAFSGRVWVVLSGPVTLYLLLTRLTGAERGFYGTFQSVVNLQIFLELGFSYSILHFTSHEFAKLSLNAAGELEGDPDARSRVISLGRLALKWYCCLALLFFLLVGSAGYWFLSRSDGAAVMNWVAPWWLLCAAASLNLLLLPVIALLEGCNRVGFVNGCRTAAGVAANVFAWIALAGGVRLFAAALSSAAMFLTSSLLVTIYCRRFFIMFRHPAPGAQVSWWREIWPFQWKIALSAMSGYLIFSLFNPVMLRARGAVEAGRMTISLNLVNAVANAAFSWVSTKAPRYGMLINARKFAELDRLSRRSMTQGFVVCLLGGLALLPSLALLNAWAPQYGAKFLGLDSIAILLAGALVTQILFGQAVYLRSHKQEPFLGLSLVNALLTAVFLILAARAYGARGACAAYFLVQLIILPFATRIFFRCRRLWHQTPGVVS